MSWRNDDFQDGYYRRDSRNRLIIIVLLAIAVLAIVVVLIAGFESRKSSTHISDILNAPEKFREKNVRINGVAVGVLSPPLLPVTFVYLDDGTGRILCRLNSNGGGIEAGSHICVEGKVTEVVDIPLLGKKSIQVMAIGGKRCQAEDHTPKLHLPWHWSHSR